MYFNAKRADWLKENGCCPEADFQRSSASSWLGDD